jgi:hypothetical protein
MENITKETLALSEAEMLEKVHDLVEAEEALLESKMTDAEKEKMSSLQTPFIQSLMAEADARLDPNQDNNRVSKVKDNTQLLAFQDEMRQKYIVPNMLENNGAIN